MTAKIEYVASYTDKTMIQRGVCATPQQLTDRHCALRQYGIEPVGEVWVSGEGLRLLFSGPVVDVDTQLMLNIKQWEKNR